MSTERTERRADEFRMTRGDGWAGTFALTVQYAIADLLTDGEPVVVTVEFEDTGHTRGVVVSAVEGGHLVSPDGSSIDTSELVAVVIA